MIHIIKQACINVTYMIFLLMFLLQKPKETVPTLAPKTLSVAAAFNEDEDVS